MHPSCSCERFRTDVGFSHAPFRRQLPSQLSQVIEALKSGHRLPAVAGLVLPGDGVRLRWAAESPRPAVFGRQVFGAGERHADRQRLLAEYTQGRRQVDYFYATEGTLTEGHEEVFQGFTSVFGRLTVRISRGVRPSVCRISNRCT